MATSKDDLETEDGYEFPCSFPLFHPSKAVMTSPLKELDSSALDEAAAFMIGFEATVKSVHEELNQAREQTNSALRRISALSEQLKTMQELFSSAQQRIRDFEEEKRSGVAKYLRLREENAVLRDKLEKYELAQNENTKTDADC